MSPDLDTLPPAVIADVVKVLAWFKANRLGKWTDMGELSAVYERWRELFRDARPPLLNYMTSAVVPVLTAWGELFLSKHGGKPDPASETPAAPVKLKKRRRRQSPRPKPPDDTEWPCQAEVARLLQEPNNRTHVQRLIARGELKTNSKAGRECRVDPASLIAYAKRMGIALNDDEGGEGRES